MLTHLVLDFSFSWEDKMANLNIYVFAEWVVSGLRTQGADSRANNSQKPRNLRERS